MSSKQRNGSYYLRYACTRRHRRRDCDLQPIPAKPLEREVIKQLTAFFDDPGNMQALIEEDQRQLTDLSSQNKVMTSDLQKRLKSVRRSIANVTEAIAERKKSKALLTKLTSLESEETDLQSQLHALTGGRVAQRTETRPFTPEEIIFLSHRLVARLHSHDNVTIRTVLQATVNKVVIDRKKTFAFGTISIHTPREPNPPADEDSPAIITASIPSPPMGAHFK